MTKIHILTPQLPYKRGFNDFFPFIKWKGLFAEKKIYFNYFSSHKKDKIVDCDIIILDYRYFQQLITTKVFPDKQFIKDFIEKAKKKGVKVVLFDSGDGTGSRCFDLTSIVDVHLRKQLLKDLDKYTKEDEGRSLMVWLPENMPTGTTYVHPCKTEDLKKLKLAWNIGMVDYRNFPFYSYYPVGTSILLNSIYFRPKVYTPSINREVLTSYRGSLKNDERYRYQRQPLIDTLKQLSHEFNVGTGGTLSKKEFQKEMNNSKIAVSPYGWGEVCYRDFECFISGALLVKPDMDHLNTFPNLFIKNETYVSLNWNMSDLEQKLRDINANYKDYLSIAEKGQQAFVNAITNGDAFVDHFTSAVIE